MTIMMSGSIIVIAQLLKNPLGVGKPLSGNKKGIWRYRIGNYRFSCELQDRRLNFLVVDIGHRKEVYTLY
ncbi:MAG: type II toxin-antitoxin system RelE/ParE family toxin [Alphaproteobacteria bacterium]|nr:type II toxin-antitoxin system RelE/ParE family toxin [Alphaproteobacteria bacterium]MBT5390238.1 type II toxin-antitoxin system RelE/ParE family toxin [Alphaproteobacteria bacterium]MBT5654778.1 type II toxin-antitoxin system RelE/ParE family toxin [Alphaproteobacteria bacterium]